MQSLRDTLNNTEESCVISRFKNGPSEVIKSPDHPSIAAVEAGDGCFNTSIKTDRIDTYEAVLVLIQLVEGSGVALPGFD